jgi:DnaJ-class molecular chaperone
MNTLSLEIDGYLSVNYSQKRDAEHRNGAEQPQQTCPSCKGTGVRRYTMWARRRTCSRCRGTGQV